MKSKIVRMKAWETKGQLGRKYKQYTYMAVPIIDPVSGNYQTGQHQTVDNPDGLTRAEQERLVEIPAKKLKKYPFVLYAVSPDKESDARYPIKHDMKLEIGVDNNGEPLNPRDAALYHWFVNYLPEVAASKDKYKPDSAHIFYIEDEEAEAEKSVSNIVKINKAMNLVLENSSLSSWEAILSFLNYNVNNFFVNYDKLTYSVLQQKLLEACQKYPDEVLKVFDPSYADHLYILKLLRYGIIGKKKDGHFYDGQLYVGASIQDVLNYLKTADGGSSLRKKWTMALNKIEQKEATPQLSE